MNLLEVVAVTLHHANGETTHLKSVNQAAEIVHTLPSHPAVQVTRSPLHRARPRMGVPPIAAMPPAKPAVKPEPPRVAAPLVPVKQSIVPEPLRAAHRSRYVRRLAGM